MKISVPATSANLGPGFDSLGLALAMKNQVIIRPAKFHSVSLKGEGANNPVLKDNNMFISIFNDFYHNLAVKKRHFRFEFINEIPLSRGLGSSSAVIVSAIASAYGIAKKHNYNLQILDTKNNIHNTNKIDYFDSIFSSLKSNKINHIPANLVAHKLHQQLYGEPKDCFE